MRQVVIDSKRIIVDRQPVDCQGLSGMSMLTAVYKDGNMAYPKFYKMDPLCRLGFIGAELILGNISDIDSDRHAVVVIGRSGSIVDDRRYQETINDTTDYFPSPAVFVYTLANIVSGEIAIRHKLYGESSSYLIENYDPELITTLMMSTFDDNDIDLITGGWIEVADENQFTLRFMTIDRKTSSDEITGFLTDNPLQ